MKFHTAAVIALVGLASWGSACADEIVDGKTGPGSLYRLVRPTNWNGRLVLYAHGFVSKAEPVALPAEADQLAVLLSSQGFALAYSSFSENGWAVKDGVQRTRQVAELFASEFGVPTGVYVAGASMGGLIAIELAERFPGDYIGVLPACAVAGGARAQFDYAANTRDIFDLLYPGVLPGNAGDVPTSVDLATQIILPALAAMAGNPSGAAAIAAVDQTPVPYATPNELLQSIVTALATHTGSFVDLVPELHGKAYFDNQGTLYTGALDPALLAAINATIARFRAAPSALNYLSKHYEPNGQIRVPMLMLSTSRDPVVPGFHQAIYSTLATNAGSAALLHQRTVDRYGHCNFAPAELAGAFFDLVTWVEFGLPPAP